MNEEQIKKTLIRAWGNAYIGNEASKTPIYVFRDIDRIASAYGLTVRDKAYAIRLMQGDVYDYADSIYAYGKYVNDNIIPYDVTWDVIVTINDL